MDDMIRTIRELVAIESVAESNCSDSKYPHGKGVNDALHYVLELCGRLGFRTKNCNEQIGWAEIGSGNPLTGILVHLDTVPLGEGWSAAQGEIRDGVLYGRGVIDDKGPAVACIYAMKELLDSGEPIQGRIRIIFGQREETGDWTDIEYYKQTEEIPDRGFTPDADFPLIFAEKGICMLTFQAPAGDSLIALNGGTASNVVPASCECQVRLADGTTRALRTQGKAAHGSMPENGINAISLLMEQLYQLHAAGEANVPFSQFYQERFGMHLHGEGFSCCLEDAVSGRLTMNCGMVSMQNGRIVLSVDVRYPVSGSFEELFSHLQKESEAYGVKVSCTTHMKPVHVALDTPLVETLLDAYRTVTREAGNAIAIGGGTYARAMDHIVAYGALLPGRPLTEHQPDEHVSIEDLHIAEKIYLSALRKLHTKASN